MTSDTGVDTFATVEFEFMTFFTFGIMRAWVIQVILDWVVWLLWMEYFLDFTGFLFFGKFGVGIDLTDFLTGFFVHIVGVCLGGGVIQVYLQFSIDYEFRCGVISIICKLFIWKWTRIQNNGSVGSYRVFIWCIVYWSLYYLIWLRIWVGSAGW